MKVAILGVGDPIGSALVKSLIERGVDVVSEKEISAKHTIDGLDEIGRVIDFKMREDIAVIPRRVPEEHSWSDRRGKSGAARIKRNAKQRRNRKGK